MTVLLSAAFLLAGLGAGRAHFALLRVATDSLILGGSAGRALVLTLARFGLSLLVLAGAALAGALPLLAAALGFGLGRAWELHRARSEP